jgi:hypothetical protein
LSEKPVADRTNTTGRPGEFQPQAILIIGDEKMSDCKYYGGITREELNSLRGDLEKEGITLPPGDDVQFEGPHGIKLTATYDAPKETLRICVAKKPFFIPDSMIWEVIDTGIKPYEGP